MKNTFGNRPIVNMVLTIGLLGSTSFITYENQAFAQTAGVANQQRVNIIISGSDAAPERTITRAVGRAVTIAAPNPGRRQRFSHWTGDTKVLDDPTRQSQRITIRKSPRDIRLVPVYKAINDPSVVVIVREQAAQSVMPGQRITISSDEPRGRTFLRWRGDVNVLEDDVTDNEQTFTVPEQNVYLRANFQAQRQGDDAAPTETEVPSQSGSDVVEIVSPREGRKLLRQGDTLIGKIKDFTTQQVVNVSIGDRETTVDVDQETGQFVVRLDIEDMLGDEVSVTFETENSQGDTQSQTYTNEIRDDRSGLTNVFSRITYGATPSLHAMLSDGRAGVNAREYIRSQLNAPYNPAPTEVVNLNLDVFASREFRSGGEALLWKISHGIFTDQQLREVMTEFWDNHFFTDDRDGVTNIRDIRGFRENAFGSFRTLLGISATSPAMMRFLANNTNRAGNINENYARELLELHTVGADAGYGPEDVIAIARVKTGWAGERLAGRGLEAATSREARFVFNGGNHDRDDKVIPFLNTTIEGRRRAEGMKEGEELLDILAMHPSTRSFICGKLTARFVADSKPEKYVEACDAAWEASDGNIKEALGAILLHEDYTRDVEYQRTKMKTPLEHVISLARAFALYPANGPAGFERQQNRFFTNLEQGILIAGYRTDGAPDGNPEDAAAWVSTGSMLHSMNAIFNVIRPREGGNRLRPNRLSDIDADLFVRNAKVKTAEGVADYMLELATAGRHKSYEIDAVVAALKGSEGMFETDRPRRLQASIRRAMTVIATLPNTFIQ